MSKQEEARQERIKRYEDLRETMRNEGFHETIRTISVIKANVMALITTLPVVLICLLLFSIRREFGFIITMTPSSLILFFLSIIVSIVVHEGLHGLTWCLFCKNKWQSIHFGVIWKALTPYCHCKETLKFGSYLLGGLMPFLVLGIGLYLVSFFTGSVFVLIISIMNIVSAGGDITIALMLCKHKNALIYDHPTDCGFIAFQP